MENPVMTNAARVPIKLVSLTELRIEHQMKLREMRNEYSVRKWMYTDHIISVDEHMAWLEKLKRDDREVVFVPMDKEAAPLGVLNVYGVDRRHKKTDWGCYLTETARGGLGAVLWYAFLNFVFAKFDVEKINSEVIEINRTVVKMHRKFLFQEEGFRRSNIIKDGRRMGVYFMGLTKDDWVAGEKELYAQHKRVFDKYEVSIEWPATTLTNPRN